MKIKAAFAIIIFLVSVCTAFTGDETVQFIVPPGFPQPVYTFKNNPVTLPVCPSPVSGTRQVIKERSSAFVRRLVRNSL